MLSQKNINIVKSTAPILSEHGEALTKHFYKRMFSHNPEVAQYFNPANQSSGSQQRALANAIYAYAANIDNLAVLGNAVELIAQKHASLLIRAEHYPIVGENLLASIQEVLGEGATEEVINAWSEAYSVLAEILINREQQIYDSNAKIEGGWSGFRKFKIDKKESENQIITSFYLKPLDKGKLPNFKSGQYITVRLPTVDGSTTMRNYSLSDVSGLDYLRISVKKESGTPNGYVSTLLHEQLQVGDTIEVGPSCGEFCIDLKESKSKPLVLLAGGIGITPIYSILKTALEAMPDREIILIQACLDEKSQAFKKSIDSLAAKHKNLKIHYRYSENQTISDNSSFGLVDKALLEAQISNKDASYYFCGPKAFMTNIHRDLLSWDIPPSQLHFEFFGPLEDLAET